MARTHQVFSWNPWPLAYKLSLLHYVLFHISTVLLVTGIFLASLANIKVHKKTTQESCLRKFMYAKKKLVFQNLELRMVDRFRESVGSLKSQWLRNSQCVDQASGPPCELMFGTNCIYCKNNQINECICFKVWK